MSNLLNKIDVKTGIIILLVAACCALGLLYYFAPSPGEGERDVWEQQKEQLESDKEDLQNEFNLALYQIEQDSIKLANKVKDFQKEKFELILTYNSAEHKLGDVKEAVRMLHKL